MGGMMKNCPKIAKLFLEVLGEGHFLKAPGTFNIFVNAVLAVSATLGNGMVIAAILRSQNLQTPSYLLITSLAFTDLLVGLLLQPLHIVLMSYYFQSKVQEVCRMTKPFLFFTVFLGSASLLMVTCISIDRYLALTLRHRYNIIVTKKRVRLSIVFAWSLAFLMAILNIPEKPFDIVFVAESCLVFVLLSITCVFYIKSFRALHLYTVQVQAQQPNPLAAGNFDVVRYKKTLKTMLLILACLVLGFAPVACCLVLISFISEKQFETIVLFFATLTISCAIATINPVIYFIRFKDIRTTCLQMLRNLFHR